MLRDFSITVVPERDMDHSDLSEYEVQRLQQIAQNKALLESLGLGNGMGIKAEVEQKRQQVMTKRREARVARAPSPARDEPTAPRRSSRLEGKACPSYKELSDRLDMIDGDGVKMEPELFEADMSKVSGSAWGRPLLKVGPTGVGGRGGWVRVPGPLHSRANISGCVLTTGCSIAVDCGQHLEHWLELPGRGHPVSVTDHD